MFLSFLIKQSAASYETVVAVVEKHFFFCRQLTVVQVNVFHTLEKALVQPYVVSMLCQDGLHLLGQGLHFIVGLGAEQVEEHRRYTLKQVVVAVFVFLGIDDGVVESRFVRVVDGLLYLLIITPDSFHESLFVVFHAYAVEGHSIVGGTVFFEKRILAYVVFTHVFFSILSIKQRQNYGKNCTLSIDYYIFNEYL